MKPKVFLTVTAGLLLTGTSSILAANRQPGNKTGEVQAITVNAPMIVTRDLSWISINGGGASYGAGGTRRLGYSVGQSVAGEGSGATLKLGIGFWYGSVRVCGAAKGDMNGVGGLTPADVVLMLNCVFLSNGAGTLGGDCNLCYADMNCSADLSPADAVLELNYVFLGAPPPCI